jgi:hypothetical protein
MTAQIEDRFLLNGESYHLKTDLSRLIHPNNWGMEPTMMHTACWRGYHGVIRVEKNTLFLDALTVNTNNGEYNQINDKMPTQEGHSAAVYSALQLILPFSGTLIAARDFDAKHYKHMGFHPISAYRTVATLNISDGHVIDCQIRQQDTSAQPTIPTRPKMPTPKEPPRRPPVTTDSNSSDGSDRASMLLEWIRARFTRHDGS